MALKVLPGITSGIAESGYIMADECTDASNIEQLIICIHWVDNMTVCKEYIGLMPLAPTNADTIVVCIMDMLLHMNLRIQDARWQYYDGYSTMTGTKNGVATQIRKLNEKCLLLYFYCHLLNLDVGDTKKNSLLKDTLDMAYEITKLKESLREEEFHQKWAEFCDKWNVISMYTIWTHQLWKSFAQQIGLSTLHHWVLFWRTIELWWSCGDGHKTTSVTLTWR